MTHVDHLVFAAPSLAAGIAAIEERLGTRAVPGGRHPSFGTHNALVGLGPRVYLEVIARDPGLPVPERGVGFGAGDVTRPRLVTWALRSVDIEAEAAAAGLGAVSSGRRERADGSLLEWRLSDPYADRLGGVVPFLIDWGATPHPAVSAPPAGELVALRLAHPAPRAVQERLGALGIDLDVARADAPGLTAVIRTPAGDVELR